MNYCALEDAYQEIGGAPSPGCAMDYATKAARKEERRKARKGKEDTHKFIPPTPPALQSISSVSEPFSEPFGHHTRINQPENPASVGSPDYDKDPLHDYVVNEQRAQVMTVPVVSEKFTAKKKFFGADPDGDAFADYIPDQENYRLQPDFLTAFEHAGVAKAGSANKASFRNEHVSKLPTAVANMYWKPLTPSGAQTSFMKDSPVQHNSQKYYSDVKQGISNAEIMKKIDKIFARLDDMNVVSPEQIHSELLMFISSGIFVLFMMDLLVKKGSTLRF